MLTTAFLPTINCWVSCLRFYEIYKRRIRTFFKKKLIKEENIELPLVNVYHNFVIYGNIKYAKFNFEHNAKLLKALKGLGYDCSMNIIEDKCKK